MYTWELVAEITGKPINEFLALLSKSELERSSAEALKAMRLLIYCGLRSYADIHDEALDLNQFAVGAAIGEEPEVTAEIVQAMADSMTTGKKMDPAPAKKKLNSAK